MKLKTIKYALLFGRSPDMLKRTEGARRVKQASKMMGENKSIISEIRGTNRFNTLLMAHDARKSQQLSSFMELYGGRNTDLYRNGKFVGTKVRTKLPVIDFKDIEGRTVAMVAKAAGLTVEQWLAKANMTCLGIDKVVVEGDLDRLAVSKLGFRTTH